MVKSVIYANSKENEGYVNYTGVWSSHITQDVIRRIDWKSNNTRFYYNTIYNGNIWLSTDPNNRTGWSKYLTPYATVYSNTAPRGYHLPLDFQFIRPSTLRYHAGTNISPYFTGESEDKSVLNFSGNIPSNSIGRFDHRMVNIDVSKQNDSKSVDLFLPALNINYIANNYLNHTDTAIWCVLTGSNKVFEIYLDGDINFTHHTSDNTESLGLLFYADTDNCTFKITFGPNFRHFNYKPTKYKNLSLNDRLIDRYYGIYASYYDIADRINHDEISAKCILAYRKNANNRVTYYTDDGTFARFGNNNNIINDTALHGGPERREDVYL